MAVLDYWFESSSSVFQTDGNNSKYVGVISKASPCESNVAGGNLPKYYGLILAPANGAIYGSQSHLVGLFPGKHRWASKFHDFVVRDNFSGDDFVWSRNIINSQVALGSIKAPHSSEETDLCRGGEKS